jgi:hypothetical protein
LIHSAPLVFLPRNRVVSAVAARYPRKAHLCLLQVKYIYMYMGYIYICIWDISHTYILQVKYTSMYCRYIPMYTAG